MNRTLPVGLALLALLTLGADDPLPRFEAKPPAEALKSFQALGGFRLDLLAAEPLVMDPVAAAYDEDGRLYVVEMTDYPHVDAAKDKPFADNQDPPIGRVRILIDDDGDGDFDRSEIFADKLSWPTGLAVWKGGVFVAATPDVWYLKDHDGDLKAEERRKVLTGFRKFNVQAVMNNLQWGLDHRIYGAGSSNGGDIRIPESPKEAGVTLGRHDFRYDPASKQFEVVSGGARFGNTFDDWGDRFLCDIRNPAEHVVLPARYLARNPFLPTPKVLNDAAEAGDAISLFRVSPPEPWRELRARRWTEVGKAMPRSELVAGGSLTSSSGLTFYRGDAYPDAYRGNLFLGEVANNLVHRMAVEPDGVTFRARRADEKAEFIASTDTWFRPVNFVNAPDGTLHVLDMYRETIEHPWSIPEDILSRLDLRSGEDRGRIYRLTPPSFQRRETPRLSGASIDELVRLLEHPNGWHRETAHRLIYERQDHVAVAPLKRLLRESKDARGRLHALYSLDGLTELENGDLQTALGDESPHVREHAVLLAEPRLAGSKSLRDAVLRLADDPAPRVRFQVAFTLGEIQGDGVAQALATIARRDAGDVWIRTAVLSSATADPAGLFDRLHDEQAFSASVEGASLLRSLALVVGARGHEDEIGRVLAALSRRERNDAAVDVALGLGDGLSRNRRKLSDLKGLPPASAEWLSGLFNSAATIAPDDSSEAVRRTQAAAVLGQADYDRASRALAPLLGPNQPSALQSAAAKALGGFDRPEVAGLLLGPWKGYTPGLRNDVVGLLLGRRSWIGPLLDAVQAGTVAPGQIPPTRRTALVNDRESTIRSRAATLFAGETVGPRATAIAAYKPALATPGNADRGRVVFERECLACHKLGTRGYAVGPNLAGVRRRTAEEILVNILDPNREVSPEFLEYVVAIDDGRVATGLVASESPTGVTLRGREAAEQTILRRNVAELSSTGKSLMPEGLEKTVAPAEMADLIAFLLRIQD
ncbi:PVC-type heme-binding CxxCH protein [Paludisphaera rhizosphaerae]|uniref:PVC-type heme-binding CxxCH protein n=1 Tax=Paludisphaera rhizosphaerae TaxID=2711216 RepID=UPI0013EE0107|nr:PVC-type heme-binding CxxCH protein [Paludisphaera rhizosphaerae]